MTDRIRLIGVPTSLTSAIREAIQSAWGAIQDEREHYGTHEFKLLGNPWSGQGRESVNARRLLNAVLYTMASYGWNVIQSVDISRKPGDKDTLFFEKGEPDPNAFMFGVSFNRTDRIRITGAPNTVPSVHDVVKQAIQTSWCGKIQEESQYYGAQEFKLEGNPWWADGFEAVSSRILLNQVLANIRALGYKLYASADITVGQRSSSSKHGDTDLETWVFRKVTPIWS